MATSENALERRANLLAKEFERQQEAFVAVLTDPHPPFMVKMNETDQLRRFLKDESSGFLFNGRVSNGGTVDDDEMDRYAAFGMRLKSKLAPELMAHEMFEYGTPEYAQFDAALRARDVALARGEEPPDGF